MWEITGTVSLGIQTHLQEACSPAIHSGMVRIVRALAIPHNLYTYWQCFDLGHR